MIISDEPKYWYYIIRREKSKEGQSICYKEEILCKMLLMNKLLIVLHYLFDTVKLSKTDTCIKRNNQIVTGITISVYLNIARKICDICIANFFLFTSLKRRTSGINVSSVNIVNN